MLGNFFFFSFTFPRQERRVRPMCKTQRVLRKRMCGVHSVGFLPAAPDPPGDLKLLVACQGPDTAVVWIPTAMDTLMTLNRPRHGFDP